MGYPDKYSISEYSDNYAIPGYSDTYAIPGYSDTYAIPGYSDTTDQDRSPAPFATCRQRSKTELLS